MLDQHFKIYVEQLRDGHDEKLSGEFSPDFLDVHDKDLILQDPVFVKGEAYLADDVLILHFDAHTYGILPCKICNAPVKTEISVKNFYHAVPLKEVKTAIFQYDEVLRETLLLEVPMLAECQQGKCPQRQKMQKYLKEEGALGDNKTEESYRPFADLDLYFDKGP